MKATLVEYPQRVETGPLRFEEDWVGYFLRGDDALSLAASIDELRAALVDVPSIPSTAVFRLGEIVAFGQRLKAVRMSKPPTDEGKRGS